MEVLLNYTLLDGELRFAELPQTADWDELSAHLVQMPGVRVVQAAPSLEGGWLEFVYGGRSFRIRQTEAGYWFFAADASCPERLMADVAAHCSQILGTGLDDASA
jgi:hypothetical protein